MTLATLDLTLEAAYADLAAGVREEPPHSNRTAIGERYGWNGVPWCAESVSVWLAAAGVPFNPSASCSVLVARFASGENGTWDVDPQRGDVGFLGSRGQDHTFLVTGREGDYVTTIEGNWADKVTELRRPISAVFGFGRPNYAGAGETPAPAPEPAPAPPASSGVEAPEWPGRLFVNRRPMMQGEDIEQWQARMIERGWDLGPDGADGWYGPRSAAVAEAFQAEKGLEVDGKVGPETWAAAWTAPVT